MSKRAGRVRISFEVLKDLLNFPAHWEVEELTRHLEDHRDGTFTIYISGSDFPEKPEGGAPLECELVYNDNKPEVKVRE